MSFGVLLLILAVVGVVLMSSDRFMATCAACDAIRRKRRHAPTKAGTSPKTGT